MRIRFWVKRLILQDLFYFVLKWNTYTSLRFYGTCTGGPESRMERLGIAVRLALRTFLTRD